MYRANDFALSQETAWLYTNLTLIEPETLSERATLLMNTAMHLPYYS